MGALVLSAFIKKMTSSERLKVINKAIFTVPPFLGSVEPSFNLTMGKSRLFNSSDDFRKVARTFPSVYELLPVYKDAYEFENDETAQNFDKYDFSTFWQQVADLDPEREDTLKKHRLMKHRFRELGKIRDENDLICDFKNLDNSLLERFIVLAGTNVATKQRIYVRHRLDHIKNFFDYEHFKETKKGDGTVPLVSAEVFKKCILTLKVKQRALETWADSRFIMWDWHAFFLNNGRVQNIIKRFLADSNMDKKEWYHSINDDTERA